MIRCRHCAFENPPRARFCLECGQALTSLCGACGTELPPGAKFCAQCGEPVAPSGGETSRFASPDSYTPRHLAERILSSRSAIEGERKQVTVVFCDLVNSTGLAERIGPEAMHALLNRFFEIALAEVHRYEGTVNQFLGDGFMALFGAPLAHEDHARRAVLSALGVQRGLRDGHDEFAVLGDEALEVRVGIHTGPVVVGSIGDNLRMDYTAVGDTTNVAARLQQGAVPGSILVSDAVARLVAEEMRLEPAGPLSLKGRRLPVTASRVLGPAPRPGAAGVLAGAPGPFLGRARVLGGLQSFLAQAINGRGQAIGVIGEPGMGKTRLLHEFFRSVAGKEVTCLEARCRSYGAAVPYLPLVDLVREVCGAAESDGNESARERVLATLGQTGIPAVEAAPFLLQLMGVKEGTEAIQRRSPEAVKGGIFESLTRLILSESRRRPLVLAIEDLHWIDKTSEDFLTGLAEGLARAPIFLLATYRPGCQPRWLSRSYASQLALLPLGREDSLTVLRAAVPDRLPDAIEQLILDKADGNPLFLEELARSAHDHGDGLHTHAPDTLQGVLMARIDRLAEAPKRVLQTAAVLGREFSPALLEVIWEGGGALEPSLRELKRLEFLYQEMRPEGTVYVFKHALTQDVAYESLLTPHRQRLHARAGETLEALHRERLDDVYDQLAHHFSRAEHGPKAVEYFRRLADKAVRAFGHAEAADALAKAIAHVERLPADPARERLRLGLLIERSGRLYDMSRFAESLDVLLREQGRVERLADPELAGRFFVRLGTTYGMAGDTRRAWEYAERALAEATRCGDEGTEAIAHIVLARECSWSGRPLLGLEHAGRAVALLEPTEHRAELSWACWALAINHGITGNLAVALRVLDRAWEVAGEIGNRWLQGNADWCRGWLLAMSGEVDAGIERCQRSLELSDQIGTGIALGFLGFAYTEKGQASEALSVFERAVEQMRVANFPGLQGFFTVGQGVAYLLLGDHERARDRTVEGTALAREVGFVPTLALGTETLGHIAAHAGALEEARRRFEEALRLYREGAMRFEEARVQFRAAPWLAPASPEAASRYLMDAYRRFRELEVPRYVERAEAMAAALGLSLEAEAVAPWPAPVVASTGWPAPAASPDPGAIISAP